MKINSTYASNLINSAAPQDDVVDRFKALWEAFNKDPTPDLAAKLLLFIEINHPKLEDAAERSDLPTVPGESFDNDLRGFSYGLQAYLGGSSPDEARDFGNNVRHYLGIDFTPEQAFAQFQASIAYFESQGIDNDYENASMVKMYLTTPGYLHILMEHTKCPIKFLSNAAAAVKAIDFFMDATHHPGVDVAMALNQAKNAVDAVLQDVRV